MSPLAPRQYRPSSASQDRQAYVPAGVQQAMSQHAQQSLPAHLKQYASGDRYVPQHAQTAIKQHLEKTAPQHMKQYAGAYVEQNVIAPSLSPSRDGAGSVRPQPRMPDQRRLDHSNVSSAQYEARFHNNMFTPDQLADPNLPQQPIPDRYAGQPQQPQSDYPAQPPIPQTGGGAYDFIMDNDPPPQQSFQMPGGKSLLGRVLLIAGALVVLMILFTVVKGLVFGKPDLQAFVAVTQDQQQIIQLATSAGKQEGLSGDAQNFSATTQASVTSAQSAMIDYLAINKTKVSPKQLNLKIDPKLDEQLATAASAGTYEATYEEIMLDQLDRYLNDLSQVYDSTSGKKGRELLQDDYNQALLLKTQLQAADASRPSQ